MQSAAKLNRISVDKGGAYDPPWLKLGHGADAEIEALVAGGITFSDIIDFLPADTLEDTAGYTRVTTSIGAEWLRLKIGRQKATVFLETRAASQSSSAASAGLMNSKT